ncbi:Uncharacterised protein at_DN2342 [Pycnogonum litorale]
MTSITMKNSKCPDTIVCISDVCKESNADSESVILKNTLNFVTSHFTAHGFSHIVSSRSMIRSITWLILVLVCMGCMWYLVFRLLFIYFEYPTSIKVEISQVQAVAFPSVTICPLNPVRDLKERKQIKEHQTGLNGLLDFYTEVITACNSKRQTKTNENEFDCTKIHPTCEWSDFSNDCSCEIDSFCSTSECKKGKLEMMSGFYGTAITRVCRCNPGMCKYVATDRCFYMSFPKYNPKDTQHFSIASTNEGDYNVNNTNIESEYEYDESSYVENYTNEYPNSTLHRYQDLLSGSYDGSTDETSETCVCEYDKDTADTMKPDAASFSQTFDRKQLSFFAYHNDFENLIKASKSLDLSDIPSTLLYARREDFKMDNFTKRTIFKDLMKSCTVNGKLCQSKHFSTSVYSKYGLCFTFNKPGNFKTQSFGTDSGLRITFTTGDSNSETYPSINPDTGLRITIHQPGTYPWPTEEGFNVPTGAITSVAVSLEEVIRQNTVKSGCIEKYDLFAGKNYSYTEQACLHHCTEMWVNANCGCYLHKDFVKTENQKRFKPCSSATDMICVNNQSLNKECEHCLPSCRESIYTPMISSAAISSRFYDFVYKARKFEKKKNVKHCTGSPPQRSDISGLHVYFPRARIKTLKEYFTYSEETLLSNIGGTLGLFFGLSVVGILEALEFIIKSIVKITERPLCTKRTLKQPT